MDIKGMVARLNEGKGAPSPVYPPPADVKVGMGATSCCYSDRHPYTIVRVSDSKKTVWVQKDNAKRADKNGMSEDQTYLFIPNPDAEIEKFQWSSSKKAYVRKGYNLWVGKRSKYYDPCF